MRRVVMMGVVGATFACQKPPDAPSARVEQPRVQREVVLPHVPPQIASRFGGGQRLLATIDFSQLDRTHFAAVVPDQLVCIRSILETVETVALDVEPDTWQLIATPLPREATQPCLAAMAPLLGMSYADSTLRRGNDTFGVQWNGDTLLVTPAGEGIAPAKLSPHMSSLVATVPDGYPLWFAASRERSPTSSDIVGWLSMTRDHIDAVVHVENSREGVARSTVADFVLGVHDFFEKHGTQEDPSWLRIVADAHIATLTISMPTAALRSQKP